jgi:hypothetical protein
MNEFFSMPVGHDPSKAAQLICKQADKIAELEKEVNVYASAFHQLKGEFVRCDNCGEQSECKDFDIFSGGTVDWLQADRDLNQQADGIESLITSGDSIEKSSMNIPYRREANKLRNQAKALKEEGND